MAAVISEPCSPMLEAGGVLRTSRTHCNSTNPIPTRGSAQLAAKAIRHRATTEIGQLT